MIDWLSIFFASISRLETVTGLPSCDGSRRTTRSARSSASKPIMLLPSDVAIVTVSKPFLMTFDGFRTDSIRFASVVSLPSLARSGPSVSPRPSPAAWHFVQLRDG